MYLETERLTVRRMEEADFPDYLAYATDEETCRMLGTWRPENEAEARESFEWLMVHEKRFYAMVLREEGRCVGHLIVQNFPDIGDLPELAGLEGRALTFCVAPAYRRRGYAAEAVRAVVDYLFEKRGVDYVNSGYFTFNEPSRRLHEKLGFRPISHPTVPLPDGGEAEGVETIRFRDPSVAARQLPHGGAKGRG